MNVKTQHSDKFCYYAAECEEASRDHQTYSVVTKTVCYGIIVFLLERFVIRSDELAISCKGRNCLSQSVEKSAAYDSESVAESYSRYQSAHDLFSRNVECAFEYL